MPTPLGSKHSSQKARRELLSLPWISLTLSGQELCSNQVFKQELYKQQVQKQLWKQQVFQQKLPVSTLAAAFCSPAATATASASSIASSLRPSRPRASRSPSTTTTTTTTTKPSFIKLWAQRKSLAPQQGSFQGEFQQLFKESAFAASTRRRRTRNFSNQRVEEVEENNNFTTMAHELEKYCTELTKVIDEEKSKMQRQLSNLELSNNIDNELTTNNDNDNELPKEFCSFRIAAYSLCFNAVHYNFVRISFSTKFVHYKLRNENEKNNELKKNFDTKSYIFRSQLQQQLPTVKKKKEQLDNLQNAANFYSAASKTKLQSRLGVQLQLQDADSSLGGQLIRPFQKASTEAFQEYTGISLADSFRSRIDKQLIRQPLDRRDLQQDSFQDSSLTEETFRQATSQPAAWQKRALDRQLLRKQLGKRDLHKGNFRNSSLEDETFSTAASKKAAWKRHFALATLQRTAWQRHFAVAASQRAGWQLSLEQPSFQTRTSRTEPSELQGRPSTTELSELERTALHTELSELQTSTFQESSLELSFGEPSFTALTAQLCFREASFLLGGGRFRTSSRRGGVLETQLASACMTLDSLSLPRPWWLKAQASPAYPRKELAPSELCSFSSLRCRCWALKL